MNDNKISRRDFVKGVATGVCAGAFASMGLYSYTQSAYDRLPKVQRKFEDFGACRSVKVINISETSWFNNAHLIGDIHDAGGLLVNQYTLNWAPFANGQGKAKGSYDSGLASIKDLIPNDLEKAWEIQKKLALHPENPGGFSCLIEVEELDGTKHKYLLDTGWSYDWMEKSFKREGIDKMLQAREIEALFISHEHWDHFWGLPVTMKYDNRIPLYVHDGFYKEGLQYIKDSGYKGTPVIQKEPMRLLPQSQKPLQSAENTTARIYPLGYSPQVDCSLNDPGWTRPSLPRAVSCLGWAPRCRMDSDLLHLWSIFYSRA